MGVNKPKIEPIIQQQVIQTKVFNGEWLDVIEDSLEYINNIVYKPREEISNRENLVNIENARRVSGQTVRHLAANSRYIRKVDEDGDVVPRKLLVNQNVNNKATYENRFIKTLINKLENFLLKRYQAISNYNNSLYLNTFNHDENFNYEDLEIDLRVKLNVYKKINFEEVEAKNKLLLKDIRRISNYINGFYNTSFYKGLKNSDEIVVPIVKTNILNNDYNYNKCYQLWVYLDSQSALKYTVKHYVNDLKLDNDKIKEVFFSIFSKLYSDEINVEDFTIDKTFKPIENKMKVLKPEATPTTKAMMENYGISEYYYQQTRKVYNRRIKERMENGEPFHVAFEDVYMGALKITENIFDDLMETPEKIKNNPTALIRFKTRNLKALESIYKTKIAGLRKMSSAQIKLLKEIDREKLKLERKKLKEKNKSLSKTEKALYKQKLDNAIIKAETKLKMQREIEKDRLKNHKALERKKAQLKLKNLRAKTNEKVKQVKKAEKDRLNLAIKKSKAKYDAKIIQEKNKFEAKLIKEKAKIWQQTEAKINNINKDAQLEIERIKSQTEAKLKLLEANPEKFLKANKE